MTVEKTEAATVIDAGIDKAAEGAVATTLVQGTEVVPALSFADEDAELDRLLAQSKAEAEAGAGKTVVAAAKAADTATTAATPAATTAATGQPVAKQPAPEALTRVLIKERTARHELARRLAIAEGQNQVLAAISRDKLNLTDEQLAAAGLPVTEDTRTTAEKIAAIDAELVQIFQKYDDAVPGFSAAECKKRELELQNQKFELQTESLRAAAVQREQAPDLALEEHTNTLEQQYPVIKNLTLEELEPFQAVAYAQAAREGKPIADGTAAGTKDLRERMAKLASQAYGGGTPAVVASGTQPATGGQPVLSETAQQRADKLALAAAHPANIAATGSGAPAGAVTDEVALQTLNAMGGDEEAQLKWLAANPKFANKVMGQTPVTAAPGR